MTMHIQACQKRSAILVTPGIHAVAPAKVQAMNGRCMHAHAVRFHNVTAVAMSQPPQPSRRCTLRIHVTAAFRAKPACRDTNSRSRKILCTYLTSAKFAYNKRPLESGGCLERSMWHRRCAVSGLRWFASTSHVAFGWCDSPAAAYGSCSLFLRVPDHPCAHVRDMHRRAHQAPRASWASACAMHMMTRMVARLNV